MRTREYKGLIFTNHALERLKQRKISQKEVWSAWKRPDMSRDAESDGAEVFLRKLNGRRIEVVASKNDENRWVVLSVWDKNVTDMEHFKGSKSLWREIKKQLRLLLTGH